MSTDTPRTNLFVQDTHEALCKRDLDRGDHYANKSNALVDFARTLERELAAKDTEIEQLRDRCRELEQLAADAVQRRDTQLAAKNAEIERLKEMYGRAMVASDANENMCARIWDALGVVEDDRMHDRPCDVILAERYTDFADCVGRTYDLLHAAVDFADSNDLDITDEVDCGLNALILQRNELSAQLAAKDAEIDLLTQLREHDVSHWKARAEKAEADVRETYRAWLGRDYQHLELPAAIGKMRADLERELAAARLDTERLDWLEEHEAGLNTSNVSVWGHRPGPHVWIDLNQPLAHFYGSSYRATIDAARKATP